MSQKQMQYSKQEIDDTWNNLRQAQVDLGNLESKDSEKKNQIVMRIRDSVRILVDTKSIPIKKSQTMLYCSNILSEKNISYSKGHFSELFSDDEKRNYSKCSQGNIHEHQFKTIGQSKKCGTWEQCECGTNRINGLIQQNMDVEKEDAFNSKKETVREITEPEGIEFEYLKLTRELFTQNINAINLIMQKCTLDLTSVKKQTTENKRRKAPQMDYHKLLESTKTLVDKRTAIVRQELDCDESSITGRKNDISQIMGAISKLNDRQKITSYEKAVAKILINKFARFNGDIASILNITTKHVKNSILKQIQKSEHDQDNLLEQTDFLVRCPGCGVGVADHFERMYEQFKSGNTINDKNFKLDSFPFPKYADQVIELKSTVRNMKIAHKVLKTNLKKQRLTIREIRKRRQ